MSDRFTPSDDELRLLTEHLCYEVSMAFELALTLATHPIGHPFVANATVEVIPIHMRQLIDFFWSERSSNPKTQRDACAALPSLRVDQAQHRHGVRRHRARGR